MNRLDQHPWIQRIRQEQAERIAWAEANPELAAAWDEASALDEEWEDRKREAALAEAERRELPKALEEVGCPFRAVSTLFEKGRETPALGAVREFLADPALAFLLMHGPPGRGKTVATIDFLRCVGVRGLHGLGPRTAEFWTAADLAVLPAFGPENEERWKRLQRIPSLVIDDIGVEAPNDWWRGRLDALIDARYSGRGLRTVITTNLAVDQFKKQYGERIARRIRETGLVRAVP